MAEEEDEGVLETIIEDIEGLDVNNWRVINNMAFGMLINPADPEDFRLVVQMETVDVGGRNPMAVRFGLNPGALESAVGSATAVLLDHDDSAEVQMVFNLWKAAIHAINVKGQEHDPDCPHHRGDEGA